MMPRKLGLALLFCLLVDASGEEVDTHRLGGKTSKGVDHDLAGLPGLVGGDSAEERNSLASRGRYAQKVKAALKEMEDIESASPDSLVAFEKAYGKPPAGHDDEEMRKKYGNYVADQVEWARAAQKAKEDFKAKAAEKLKKENAWDNDELHNPIGFERGNDVEDGTELAKGHTPKDRNLMNPWEDGNMTKYGEMTPWEAARLRVEELTREVLDDKTSAHLLRFDDIGAEVRAGLKAPLTDVKKDGNYMVDPDVDVDVKATEYAQKMYDEYMKKYPDNDQYVKGQEQMLHDNSSPKADADAVHQDFKWSLKFQNNAKWQMNQQSILGLIDQAAAAEKAAKKSGDPKDKKAADDMEASAMRLKKEYLDSGAIDKFVNSQDPDEPEPTPPPETEEEKKWISPAMAAQVPGISSSVVFASLAIVMTAVAFASVIIARVQQQNNQASGCLLGDDVA